MRRRTGHPVIEHEDAIATVGKFAGPERQCSVLVVENDPDLQWQLARSLTVRGHRVVGTSTGDGALAVVEQWPVDLALVAEDLPGVDGVEVARMLQGRMPGVPIVLMTAHRDGEVHLAARLAGAAACFVKPLAPETLGEIFASFGLCPEPAE